MENVFEQVSSYVGYVYPNETEIPWTELIVMIQIERFLRNII